MATIKHVNETGIKHLKAWILETANEDHAHVDSDNLDAWCCEAEESMGNGNPPMVEMTGIATLSGNPETFIVPAGGIDEQDIDD